jgi:putative oxidoreductase
METDINDRVILAARLLLAALFLIFSWRKLTDYSGTVRRMVQDGVPVLASAIAIFVELPVAFALAVGAFTRPSAMLLAIYTLEDSLEVGWIRGSSPRMTIEQVARLPE